MQYAATEVFNIEGLMSDSQLKFNVISGSNFYHNNKALSVRLTCEGQVSETDRSRSPIEPVWNSLFKFDITSIHSKLDVEICGDSTPIAEFTIPLKLIQDQIEQTDVNM